MIAMEAMRSNIHNNDIERKSAEKFDLDRHSVKCLLFIQWQMLSTSRQRENDKKYLHKHINSVYIEF